MNTSLVFGLALVLSLVLTPLMRKIALRTGFVDIPVARSMHKEPKPYLGGVAIFLAFAAAVLLGGGVPDQKEIGILVGGGLTVLLGVVDDKVRLSAKVKLIGQIVAAAVLVYGFDVKIEHIYSPLGARYVPFGAFAGPLTIFWVVAFVNVINLIDGLDGLAAGISSIASLTLLLVSLQNNFASAIVLTAALAGSAIGFLRYNFNPAKIFMGDAGSMFLGFTLAAVSVHGVLKTTATVGVFVPVLALALPIFDTAFAIIRRVANGRSIGEADKDHLHHRLLRLGLSHRNTVLVMWTISAWLGLSAVAMTEVSLRQALIIMAMVLLGILFGAKKVGLLDVTATTPPVTAPKQKSIGR
ncbi:MAG TPA: MraY family glycosyltransferase [Symbiobacteriaceae bacterium]|nr:MraY family glycosyltransferase [Symbiobacteriaceae bacterium]